MSLVFRARHGAMRLATAGRRAPLVPTPLPNDAAMARLVHLHEAGALSDAEFAAATRAASRVQRG